MAANTRRRLLAVRFICGLVLAPTVIGLIVYHLASWFGLAYKPFLVVCGVIVGWPISFSLTVGYEGWRRTRNARAAGAVTASEPHWKSFGSIGVIQELQEITKNGFIGEPVCLECKPRVVEPSL